MPQLGAHHVAAGASALLASSRNVAQHVCSAGVCYSTLTGASRGSWAASAHGR